MVNDILIQIETLMSIIFDVNRQSVGMWIMLVPAIIRCCCCYFDNCIETLHYGFDFDGNYQFIYFTSYPMPQSMNFKVELHTETFDRKIRANLFKLLEWLKKVCLHLMFENISIRIKLWFLIKPIKMIVPCFCCSFIVIFETNYEESKNFW